LTDEATGDAPPATDRAGPAVRHADRADARAVADIQIAGWRAAYRGLVPDAILDGFDLEVRTARWAEIIRRAHREDTRIWVVSTGPAPDADADGADDADADSVIGFAMSGPGRHESAPPPAGAGEVYALYVRPAAIGHGYGRALFSAATGELLATGFDPIVVWVFEANERARRFYEAAGFRPDGARHAIDFDGTPVDEIRYRLDDAD
jgi:ribosomal protein S18 acetylase RimI-like enzyme